MDGGAGGKFSRLGGGLAGEAPNVQTRGTPAVLSWSGQLEGSEFSARLAVARTSAPA